MLDFILVLGHVPGTNIYITFYQLVAFLALVSLCFYLARRKPLLLKRWLLVAYLSLLLAYHLMMIQSHKLINSVHRRLPA